MAMNPGDQPHVLIEDSDVAEWRALGRQLLQRSPELFDAMLRLAQEMAAQTRDGTPSSDEPGPVR